LCSCSGGTGDEPSVAADGLWPTLVGGWGATSLRCSCNPARMVTTSCCLCRKDPKRRQTRRASRPAADEVRVDHQPQDREGPRPHDPAVSTRSRGRDRPVTESADDAGSCASTFSKTSGARSPMPWRARCYECGPEVPITLPVYETSRKGMAGSLSERSVECWPRQSVK